MNIQHNVDLKQFTTVKSPTIATFFTTVTTREEFIEALKYSCDHHMKSMIIGGGSNTVFAADKIDAFVIRNQYFAFEVLNETDTSADIKVSAGLPVSMLVQKTIEKGLEGFEYHQGLPGSVGGALYMNSKWTRPLTYFSDKLISATLIDAEGNEKQVERDYFQFAYDYSILQKTHEVLVDAVFRLKKADKDTLKKRADESLAYRKKTQPFGVASSGCVFQNIDGQSAGALIDKAGLKGTRVGKFVVSDVHANFIINEGDDNMDNLKKLIALVKETVKTKFGVELKEEIRVIE